jgi:hypothetical protein
MQQLQQHSLLELDGHQERLKLPDLSKETKIPQQFRV